jgi:hypothetical protein
MTDTTVRARRAAAPVAGLVAVLYVLTGAGWVAVTADQGPGAIPPLLIGAVLYALLAALLVLGPGRRVYLAGAVLQLPMLLMYLAVAADRTPSYEVWGLTIKALQLLLLAVCLLLAAGSRSAAPRRRAVEPV